MGEHVVNTQEGEKGVGRNQTCRRFDLELPASRTKKELDVAEAPSLWCFVVAASAANSDASY